MLSKPIRATMAALLTLAAILIPAQAQDSDIVEGWFDNAVMSGPNSFEGQKRGYLTGGSFSGRFQMSNDALFTVSPPRIEASCGGIDLFAGGISYLDPEYLVQKLENILQAAPAVAFSMALSHICPSCDTIVARMEDIANELNAIQLNDCQAANRLVRYVADGDPQAVMQDMRTAMSNVGQDLGLVKNAQHTNERLAANDNQVPADTPLRNEIESCPAELKALLTEGSVVGAMAERMGMEDYTDVIRGFVGDVHIDWPEDQVTPAYRSVPPCPTNDPGSLRDFVEGLTQMRQSEDDECAANIGTSLRAIVAGHMTSIAAKLATDTVLTDEENAFLGQSDGLGVYQRLQSAVVNNTVGETIIATQDLVATTYAYQILDDLFHNVDYGITVAIADVEKLGVDVDDETGRPCNPALLRPGKAHLLRMQAYLREARHLSKDDLLAALEQHNTTVEHLVAIYAQKTRDVEGFTVNASDEN